MASEERNELKVTLYKQLDKLSILTKNTVETDTMKLFITDASNEELNECINYIQNIYNWLVKLQLVEQDSVVSLKLFIENNEPGLAVLDIFKNVTFPPHIKNIDFTLLNSNLFKHRSLYRVTILEDKNIHHTNANYIALSKLVKSGVVVLPHDVIMRLMKIKIQPFERDLDNVITGNTRFLHKRDLKYYVLTDILNMIRVDTINNLDNIEKANEIISRVHNLKIDLFTVTVLDGSAAEGIKYVEHYKKFISIYDRWFNEALEEVKNG